MIPNIPKDRAPKISVVTVSFNQGVFIKQNIESVIAQKYPLVEHIVVDGGSQDETVGILKSYPHLQWTSEPDRGQTHALNKGFKRASGDIIAWLNSDDWYPEGVFHEVAEQLRDYPIVMGACQVTDKEGKPTEYVPNVCRSWFDILKYWIFYSSPSQPSIFFRREVLEECKRNDGTYLDEGLDFCMDYEFWLRVTQKYPMVRYIPKVISYCRTYDTNKTGQDMDSVYREMSRAFSRHSNVNANSERKISFLIPFTEYNEMVLRSVQSAIQQTLQDFEVVLVDYNADQTIGKQNRRSVLNLEKTIPRITIRYVRCLEANLMQALNHGFHCACAPLVAVLIPGTQIPNTLCFDMSNIYRQDIIGLVLPIKHRPELQSLLVKKPDGGTQLNISAMLTAGWIPPCFVARKVALMESGGIKTWQSEYFAVRELLMRLTYRGWHIHVDTSIDIKLPEEDERHRNEFLSLFGNYVNARILSDLRDEYERDEFGHLRAKHGFALVLPDQLVENAKNISKRMPENWQSIGSHMEESTLMELSKAAPNFAPIYYFLSIRLEKSGRLMEAKSYMDKFAALRAEEKL